MSNLRELPNAELDLVSGGATIKKPEPPRPIELCGNPVLTLIEDIIRVVERLEGNNPGRMKVAA
jgi:hypothetical protein